MEKLNFSDKSDDNLYNTKNYHKNLDINNYNEYLSKYIDIINEYLIHSSTIVQTVNTPLYIFTHQRGLNTIKHIFKHLLFYTKNVDLTIHHCKKGYLYYVEFISQIGEDSHSYLQLNSKDASLFVYKKTIYEINNSHKKICKISQNEKKIFSLMNSVIEIYERLIFISIDKFDFSKIENRKQNFVTIEKECLKLINNFFLEKIVYKTYINNCNLFSTFLNLILLDKNLDINYIYAISNLFLKKIFDKKKKINVNKLQKKMFNFISKNEFNTPVKYINLLFNFK